MKGRDWSAAPLGQKPDSVLAVEFGCSVPTIRAARQRLGIPAFIGLILTQEGVPTRSLYEAKYDAWLHWKGLDHRHEVPVPGLPYIADFEVSGRVFVEIAGMARLPRYAAKMAAKQADYERFNVPVTWLTPEMVDRMFQECPVPLKFRDRQCTDCGVSTHDLVQGACRPCHRKRWGQENANEASCANCGDRFQRNGGSPNQQFCSHDCYAKSLELAWPSWEEIDARLETTSVHALAGELGVKPSTLYMRLRRRQQRDVSAPVVRDSRRKLMAEDVLEIRRRHAGGESQASLRCLFEVSPVTIHNIVHRVTWKEV